MVDEDVLGHGGLCPVRDMALLGGCFLNSVSCLISGFSCF
ncbi:hypothetical protein HAT2_00163 [Candidatus Similichlamydia laticola]|uniref:Uncharacterized protein n=1 Tax=Candidatus Similichlamydia laticola TaxID=2170265 RepID=A0A369KJ24_9BACT|nr:hypothetical protein HAT2_00163 [Candidatus Similichlamydia laticola]